MPSQRTLSRRRFLLGAAALAGASALSVARRLGSIPAAFGQDSPPPVLLPYVVRAYSAPSPLRGKVVHVHGAAVQGWTGQSDYWNYLSQDTVDAMVDRGVMELTGAATAADAWRTLIPNYQGGQKVAIKVNFNNCGTCDSTSPVIDALMQPVNAVARGLISLGMAPADICVYDAVRSLPDRFVAADRYGLSFYGGCRFTPGFTDVSEAYVTFYPPEGVYVYPERVTDVLRGAAYLINMPIMKGGHPAAGVTLGFKNHFGTINSCGNLHDLINVVSQPPGYRTDYNPLVDLVRSPLIGGKTVLTVGDGLFAGRHFADPPVPWSTFDDQLPNSLFFATDPVAVDCVMHDLIVAEPGTDVPAGANNYLYLAGLAGLGAFEQGDPWLLPYGSGYNTIQYTRVEV